MKDSTDFGFTYFDSLAVSKTSEAVVMNTGTSTLKVLSVEGNGNFYGSNPGISAAPGTNITVPLYWEASGVGDDEGDVVIRTTGGDLTVHCYGVTEKLPYDYSKVVSEGDFSFNTDAQWPFVMSANGKYAYNSSSKQEIDHETFSWLTASFDVPEGMIGHLFWDADNDSEDIFEMMGYQALLSGTKSPSTMIRKFL